ncbi:cation diffusion facilitator family transporter [Nocardioides lacus]|uniref:cation diffusion facilitator family transporter n=1 Tax=Nocardioides sp. BP30 TaxID=3036374 RepID=UPI0032AEC426
MLGEVVVAIVAGSLALLSDAGHMLSDVGAIAAALWAMRLAARPPSGAWTFGWKRAEILSAAANGITLVVIAAVVAVEALRRLLTTHPEVSGGAVLAVALVGIAVNIAATWLLAKASRRSLNVRGAYLHLLTDLFGFVGTAVAAVVIVTTGWTQADAVASLLVAVLMAHAGSGLLAASGRVLLEAAPSGVELTAVRTHLLEVNHVLDVHDLHVWTVTSDLPSLSAHLVLDDACFNDGHAPQILDQVQECLGGHFDVEHSTFQLEPRSHQEHEPGVH